MRTQAHLELVKKITPIVGAEKVEMCTVLDYDVVVQKSNAFKPNDLVVYIEIDSILPDGLSQEKKIELRALKKQLESTSKLDRAPIQEKIDAVLSTSTAPEFEFLRSKNFKIKTMKFNSIGVYSLGIVFGLDLITNTIARLPDTSPYKTFVPDVGKDVTELLGIKKIEDDDESISNVERVSSKLESVFMRFSWYRMARGKIKKMFKVCGTWPSFLPSPSDENNIQQIFSRVKNKIGTERLIATEKLEGQNVSIFTKKVPFLFWTRRIVGVCSHTRYIRDKDYPVVKSIRRLGYDKKVRDIGGEWFIRGEHCGPEIQCAAKNIYGLTEKKFYVFEVWNLTNRSILNFEQTKGFCAQHGFEMVPIVNDNYKLANTVDEVLKYSDGLSAIGSHPRREGIIIRDFSYKYSMKAKNPIYLAEHGL